MPTIIMQQHFNAPPETVFDTLCDHAKFGQLTGANITRIKDGQAPYANGLGSVRRINLFPLPSFDETVVMYEPGKRMEYIISRGSPLKDHRGVMRFESENGGTRLDYSITFEPRLNVPFAGNLLKSVIEYPIRKGLERLAKRYQK